ncbi:hypothetical protein ACHAXN_005308 [Cyclotella atomus]
MVRRGIVVEGDIVVLNLTSLLYINRMFRHKSLGLLTGLIVAPRLGYRLFNSAKVGDDRYDETYYDLNPYVTNLLFHLQYQIGHPTGTGPIEGKLADASHFFLYGFMTIMPATGIAMGYYGGKGLPFFFTTIPGAAEANGAIAKQSFSIHKTLGVYGKYLIPIHVGGAVKHSISGHTIWSRINPFGRPMH